MTRSTLAAALVFLSFGTTVSFALDVRYLYGLGDTRYQAIDSKTIGRRFHLYVMLPDGYDDAPDVEYPTVYVLDGGGLFPLLAAYYRYLRFAEESPDLIIVGIGYAGPTFEDGNYRSTDYTAPAADRDYWGGADDFQAFLADELIPMIEGEYRSRPTRRIVFGQSIGGQFVLYTALTRPDLFWGHLASNPALHRNLAFFMEFRGEPNAEPASKLFVASASNDAPEFREPALEWISHWAAKDELPWQLRTTTLEDHSHMSAPPAAFRNGMMWLFFGD